MNKNTRIPSKETLIIIGVMLGTFFVWLLGWMVVFGKYLPNEITSQPFSDTFNSLNALFAGLAFAGVIATIYLQIKELRETRIELQRTAEANQKLAKESDEKAIIELYKIYCSEYFQTVKNSSMSVLIPCVSSKEYYQYVISRFFVADQEAFPESCWGKVSKSSRSSSIEEFRNEEINNRYKLDELINFFTILADKSNSKEIIRRCDFSYSWWRPLFWMIAKGQQERYAQSKSIQKYNTPPYFSEVVAKLDVIYEFESFSPKNEFWSYIRSHPKILQYGLDDSY